MFGSKKRSLEAHGQTAGATVTKASKSISTGMGQRESGVDGQRSWHLEVMVEPSGQPAFAAKFTAKIEWNVEIAPGTKIAVLFDPDDHSKVMIDTSMAGARSVGMDVISNLLSNRSGGGTNPAEMAELLRQQVENPGSDQSALAAALGGNATIASSGAAADQPSAQGLDGAPVRAAEDGREQQIAKAQQIVAAMGGGRSGHQPTIFIHGEQVRSAPSHAAPDASEDPVQLLTQLAQLHAQGVLNDEEFEAQKARLLAQ